MQIPTDVALPDEWAELLSKDRLAGVSIDDQLVLYATVESRDILQRVYAHMTAYEAMTDGFLKMEVNRTRAHLWRMLNGFDKDKYNAESVMED